MSTQTTTDHPERLPGVNQTPETTRPIEVVLDDPAIDQAAADARRILAIALGPTAVGD